MCAEHPGDLHRDGVRRRLHIHLDQLLRPEYQVKTSFGSDLTGVGAVFTGFVSRSIAGSLVYSYITFTQGQTSKHQTLIWSARFDDFKPL